jgi:hypothetical protein
MSHDTCRSRVRPNQRLERTGGEAGCHVRAEVAAGRSTASRWATEERSRACLVACRACGQHKWQRWKTASAALTRMRCGHACHLCCRGE